MQNNSILDIVIILHYWQAFPGKGHLYIMRNLQTLSESQETCDLTFLKIWHHFTDY
jgi:hypothetical protein